MAKSPVGGSRAFLKGRVGSDVYSLGKDGKGKRQQVVRSLAEEVANPRTVSQMANRMIMSTVMQAVKFLNPVIDHSFDGVPVGQPSISEFIRRNYAILKAGNGEYNEYQEKGVKRNALVVSVGKAKWPAGVSFGQCDDDDSSAYGKYSVNISLDGAEHTVGELRALLQAGSNDDYITVVNVNSNGGYTPAIARFRVNPALADSTAITNEMENLFVIEGNYSYAQAAVVVDSTGTAHVTISLNAGNANQSKGVGAILSTKKGGAWTHTSCTLLCTGVDSNYATALATYPVGTEQFLNGGSL